MNEPLYILSKNPIEVVSVIDDYYELLWVEKAFGVGEFELKLPTSYIGSEHLVTGNLVVNSHIIKETREKEGHSKTRFMVIEGLNPQYSETGDSLIATGPSGESFLKYRKTGPTYFDGDSMDIRVYINDLIADNFVNPSNQKRKLPNFVVDTGDLDDINTSGVFEPFESQIVYDIVSYLCYTFGIELRVLLDYDASVFVTEFYFGVDRTFNQSVNSYVTFSKEYDNVISSDYYITTFGAKNVCYVVSEDETPDLQVVDAYFGNEPEGFDRREMVLTSSAVPRDIDGYSVSEAQAENALTNKGLYELNQRAPKGVYDGQVLYDRGFVYLSDYRMTDLVNVIFGGSWKAALVKEVVRSYLEGGVKTSLSFDFDI